MLINTYADLAGALGSLDPTEASVNRAVYQATDCGAWAKFLPAVPSAGTRHRRSPGVQFGSIVEGSDAEIGPYTLRFPFDVEEMWAILDMIDAEAGRLWHEANDPLDDEPDATEPGPKKLWLLQSIPAEVAKARVDPWDPPYDCMFGVVVRAGSEQEARQLASGVAQDEGRWPWLASELTSCIELSPDGEDAVILKNIGLQ